MVNKFIIRSSLPKDEDIKREKSPYEKLIDESKENTLEENEFEEKEKIYEELDKEIEEFRESYEKLKDEVGEEEITPDIKKIENNGVQESSMALNDIEAYISKSNFNNINFKYFNEL